MNALLVLLCLKENALQQPKKLVLSLTLKICFMLAHGIILRASVFLNRITIFTTYLGIVVA